MATRNIVPRANGEGQLGTSLKKWLKGFFGSGGLDVGGDILPADDNVEKIGSAIKQFNDVFATHMTLAGVQRTTWPAAGAGSQSLDDVYNNGSQAAVDDTNVVWKLSAGKKLQITNADGSIVYLEVTGDQGITGSSGIVEAENYAENIRYPALSTDGTLSANSDLLESSQKAIKTYADTKVGKSLYDANTILAANADDTPLAVAIGELAVVGRLTGGNIKALAQYELASLIASSENAFEIIAY